MKKVHPDSTVDVRLVLQSTTYKNLETKYLRRVQVRPRGMTEGVLLWPMGCGEIRWWLWCYGAHAHARTQAPHSCV